MPKNRNRDTTNPDVLVERIASLAKLVDEDMRHRNELIGVNEILDVLKERLTQCRERLDASRNRAKAQAKADKQKALDIKRLDAKHKALNDQAEADNKAKAEQMEKRQAEMDASGK